MSQRSPGQALLDAGIKPIAPGLYLRKHVLRPKDLDSPAAAAEAIGISVDVLEDVLASRRPIDEQIAAKLAKFSQVKEGFWLNMQSAFDHSQRLSLARRALSATQ